MKFSKRTHYGFNFLLRLSLQWPKYCTVSEVSVAENLPEKFVEGIASDLRKTEIIEVKRGAGGGYRLTRSLKDIQLIEVLSVLEPDWVYHESDTKGMLEGKKAVMLFLDDISSSIYERLSVISMEQMLRHYQKDVAPLYYI